MRYTVDTTKRDGFEIARLRDDETGLSAEIVPGLGLRVVSLQVRGQEFIWMPGVALDCVAKNRLMCGIPFLSPWANRLEECAYWVNGARYKLNEELGNLRFDRDRQPIHGLMLFERWKTERLVAGDQGAELVTSFDFTKRPKLMAQFPFAHTLEVRHRIAEGRLHVQLRIENQSGEPYPVSVGFHPYYRLPGAGRSQWKLYSCAQRHYELNEKSIPTGEQETAIDNEIELGHTDLDDLYGSLQRGADETAVFRVTSPDAQLSAGFGSQFRVAVLYAPPAMEYFCIEPMTAITNALNLSHAGKYAALPAIAPGGEWHAGFWIHPSLTS